MISLSSAELAARVGERGWDTDGTGTLSGFSGMFIHLTLYKLLTYIRYVEHYK